MPARRTAIQLFAIYIVSVAASLAASRFAATPELPPHATAKLFVLAGQSNMAGRAPAVELPGSFRQPPARVLLDYVCSFGASDLLKPEDYPKDAGPPEPHHSDGWVPLQPAPKHVSTPGEHFGPEIGFGHALAAAWPQQPITIVKHGRGSTSLAVDWAPGATSGRQLYRAMLTQVSRAVASLKAKGITVELGALIWCQGEADTTRSEWADAYEGNLAAFFAAVRRDLSAPELPIVFSLTGDGRQNPKMSFAAPVRRAQEAVAARDARTRLVQADDLALLDHVHYNAASQLTLGQRLADAYLDIPPARH